MPGYVKIWTDIRNDKWFRSLPIAARGIWYELLCLCKERGDTGTIAYKNVSQLAMEMNAERRTLDKWLTKFQSDRKIVIDRSVSDVLSIEVVNYERWQQVTLKDLQQRRPRRRLTNPSDFGKNPALLAEQSKAEHCASERGEVVIKDERDQGGSVDPERVTELFRVGVESKLV